MKRERDKNHTSLLTRNRNRAHRDGDDDPRAGSYIGDAEEEEVVDTRYQNSPGRIHTAGAAAEAAAEGTLPRIPAVGTLPHIPAVVAVEGKEIRTL